MNVAASSPDAPVTHETQEASDEERRQVRAAMLSVYHRSLGRRLELRGAPAILLPPDAEPESLATALETLAKVAPRRLPEAIWTIVRGVVPARSGERPAYPRELHLFLDGAGREQLRTNLAEFDGRRQKYRRQAHLYGLALTAYAQEDESLEPFNLLLGQLPNADDEAEAQTASLDASTKGLGLLRNEAGSHLSFADYLKAELPTHGEQAETARAQLRKLESELGISLTTYVQEFADVVAFAETFGFDEDEEVRVFPASSVTVQDAASLETQVTVTALVATERFDCLQIGMDPQCWSLCSESFVSTCYVTDTYDLTPLKPPLMDGEYERKPETREEALLLEENVSLSSQVDGTEIAAFHNVLNVWMPKPRPAGEIKIMFDLNRSISSRILWDERAGGMLVNEGYLRAQPLGKGVWRITTRKTLRFSDRTPYSAGPGWNDYGQMLNYLAPAALSSWIENEMYSAKCPEVLKRARSRTAGDQGETRD